MSVINVPESQLKTQDITQHVEQQEREEEAEEEEEEYSEASWAMILSFWVKIRT